MKFPETLKHLMEERELKQADLCRMTGIPSSLMSNYIKGAKFPSLSNSIALARALNVSIDALAGLSDLEKSAPISEGGPSDDELIKLWNMLSPEEILRMRDFAQGLIASRKNPSSHQA